MPKIFGLRLRDIVSPPANLKLDADPIKAPSSPTGFRAPQLTRRRATSFKSTKRLSRMAKLLRSSTSSPDMDKSEEHRRLIDQRIQDLPAFPGISGDKNHMGDSQAEHVHGLHRSTGHRTRKALSGLGFGRPATNEAED
ncbi:hypothetical protein A7U60_g8660 [Sanghuangporus baumii]|uniref:Uncharacterized protein n=1 Tax=Sanghuangporus baumii TaxID=108892 RepID=A0A9Q5N7T6_SANBA|nr:hypothetical protein A7U60_g8660 [Sanghuangporus baumii]